MEKFNESMGRIEAKIGYVFKDQTLLVAALTHSSHANEQLLNVPPNYERNEFLGDAVLGLISGEFLMEKYPEMKEGELTKLRSNIVCEASLYECGQTLALSRHILLGKGEENSGGRGRISIIADVVEALIGAIYLDGGLLAARNFIEKFILHDINERYFDTDNKSLIHEYVAKHALGKLSYELTGISGPGHDKEYHIDIYLETKKIGSGSGSSKKNAEQQAAKEALPYVETLIERHG